MWSAEQGRPVQRESHASPSHQDRLRRQLDDVHRQLDYTRAECQKWSKLVAGVNCTMYVGATF